MKNDAEMKEMHSVPGRFLKLNSWREPWVSVVMQMI
jgi:hypothetical protein